MSQMTDYWSKTLETAGWTAVTHDLDDVFIHVVHKQTGQIVYIEFEGDEDDPVSDIFQIVEALTTKVVKNRKVVEQHDC